MMLLGGLQGLSASYGKGGQNSIAKDTVHKESTVSAGRIARIDSGKDTDIKRVVSSMRKSRYR